MEVNLVKKVRNISLLLSILVFINILFGPLVRATNSGLACPDWPLCYGRVLPPAEFRIWMEVGHRFYSGGIGIILLFLSYTILKSPFLRNKFGVIILFASAVILFQIILGALTVTKLLDPTTVNMHLLNAVLFLLTVVGIYLRSRYFLQNEVGENTFSLSSLLNIGGVLGVFIFFLVYYQLYMGGRVSSNYAGLACPDWPLCQGSWIPKPFAGPVRYHVEHRFTAYLVLLLILVKFIHAFLKKQNKKDVLFSTLLLFFCSLQILIGVYNVLWGIPTLLTAIHTANGVALLLCSFFVVHNSLTLSTDIKTI
jgi:cytochrome c oxidase assembly protein subunit 15